MFTFGAVGGILPYPLFTPPLATSLKRFTGRLLNYAVVFAGSIGATYAHTKNPAIIPTATQNKANACPEPSMLVVAFPP
jgi:hypothetical protein